MSRTVSDVIAFCIPDEDEVSLYVINPDFVAEALATFWRRFLEVNADKLPDTFTPPTVWIGRFSGVLDGDWHGVFKRQGREFPVMDSVIQM